MGQNRGGGPRQQSPDGPGAVSSQTSLLGQLPHRRLTPLTKPGAGPQPIPGQTAPVLTAWPEHHRYPGLRPALGPSDDRESPGPAAAPSAVPLPPPAGHWRPAFRPRPRGHSPSASPDAAPGPCAGPICTRQTLALGRIPAQAGHQPSRPWPPVRAAHPARVRDRQGRGIHRLPGIRGQRGSPVCPQLVESAPEPAAPAVKCALARQCGKVMAPVLADFLRDCHLCGG